ncbi:hypothetical protein YTPLAS72_36980 [Nitrospira sp.]|nr:hypothetical protein YTPLAS72_36980 [Nitrospira sp.]
MASCSWANVAPEEIDIWDPSACQGVRTSEYKWQALLEFLARASLISTDYNIWNQDDTRGGTSARAIFIKRRHAH